MQEKKVKWERFRLIAKFIEKVRLRKFWVYLQDSQNNCKNVKEKGLGSFAKFVRKSYK